MDIRPTKEVETVDVEVENPQQEQQQPRPNFWHAALPVFACGAGLFSDGYINNVWNISRS